MKLPKSLLPVALAATTLFATSCGGAEAAYPSRKIEIMVAYSAGSANDTIARAFGAALEEVSGANVLVINRPGAGGIVGTTESMLETPDGYSLLLAPIAAFTNAPLLQETHYDTDDFVTVTPLAQQPFAITVRADSPYNSLADLAEADDAITYGTLGVGHASEVIMAEILNDLDTEGRGVPFNGSGEVIQSVAAQETDISMTDANSALPRIQSGELKVLAVTGDERMDVLPDTPTVTEEGFPDADYLATQALAVQAGIDADVLETLRELSKQAVATDTYQEFLTATNTNIQDLPGNEWMDVYAPEEKERLKRAYAELGIAQND